MWRVILTLIPIRPFYQTSAGMASVGDGRLGMRRLASLSSLFPSYVHLYLYTKPRAGWGSVGDGRLRMRPPAGYDHIRKVTLSQKKPRCRKPLGPWGVKEPLVSSHISVLDGHGAQTWN